MTRDVQSTPKRPPLTPEKKAGRAARAFAKKIAYALDEAEGREGSLAQNIVCGWTDGMLVICARNEKASRLAQLVKEHGIAIPDMPRPK